MIESADGFCLLTTSCRCFEETAPSGLGEGFTRLRSRCERAGAPRPAGLVAIEDLNRRSAVCLVVEDQCLPDRAALGCGVWAYGQYVQIMGRILFGQVQHASMATKADKRGRIYLPKDIREKHGRNYRIVELPSHVALVPVADDPLAASRRKLVTPWRAKTSTSSKPTPDRRRLARSRPSATTKRPDRGCTSRATSCSRWRSPRTG